MKMLSKFVLKWFILRNLQLNEKKYIYFTHLNIYVRSTIKMFFNIFLFLIISFSGINSFRLPSNDRYLKSSFNLF